MGNQSDNNQQSREGDDSIAAPAATAPMPRARRGFGANEIVKQLRTAIAQNHYSHGDRLPAERDLAAQFGTSRGTARHALLQLEKMNLVTRRVGSGTFVNSPGLESSNDIAETTGPLELMEVRFAIEPHMVRLAVANASVRDLEHMHRALQHVEAAQGSDEFTEADGNFHLALAECSQNPLLIWLYRQINDVRGHSQWVAVKEKILTPQRIAQYNEHHRGIYSAVASRDTSHAVSAMNDHLAMARNDLLGAQDPPDDGGRVHHK